MKYILIIGLTFAMLHSSGQQTVGLFSDSAGSAEGYVLFAPIKSDTTYLIDKCGKRIHSWASDTKPGLSVYLLPDGSLLKTGSVPNTHFSGTGGAGGEIEKHDWNNNLTWSYTISSDTQTQNHDIYPMPNGNVLVDIWEALSPAQAIAAGRKPALTGTALWSARIEELQPVGTDSAIIVWQWRLWDHLIQDFDSTKANYGVIADHPELLNVNFYQAMDSLSPDWVHMNAVTYNATLDQIMFSGHNLSEIYILDHSTGTTQAATHTGGIHGKGGDFLYRWGNPKAYNSGTRMNRTLYQQHNPTWIPSGYPGANDIMIFNNGLGRPGGNSSSVDVIAQPVDSAGDYALTAGQAYAPTAAYWSYMGTPADSFYSDVMGSAQRLPNGNTIICEATKGHFFEIDSAEHIVWSYVNPVDSSGIMVQGSTSATNQVFRCIYYAPDYSAFAGQTLTPGDPIEINPLSYSCAMLTGINNVLSNKSPGIRIINPFSNQILIRSVIEVADGIVTLSDMTGQVILKWNEVYIPAQNDKSLSVYSDLADGIYLLSIKNSTTNFSAKVVHQ